MLFAHYVWILLNCLFCTLMAFAICPKIKRFADDTSVLCSGGGLQKLREEMMPEITKLKIWLDRN